MSASLRIARALVRTYPSSWRREYGEELEALLLARPLDWRVVADVLRNGLWQRMRAALGVAMTVDVASDSFLRFLWRRALWIVGAGAVAAGATYVASGYLPKQYESRAVILVFPSEVPESVISSLPGPTLPQRVAAITQQIMSRTRIEDMIGEFGLTVRAGEIMEDAVERVRRTIDIRPMGQDTVVVTVVGSDPRMIQRLAEKAAGLIIVASLANRERVAEGTDEFLEGQLQILSKRLIEARRRAAAAGPAASPEGLVPALEYDMLQAQYRSLFEKHETVGLYVNLERRQIGEQFKLIDAARVPTDPISPNRMELTGYGAFAGLALGMMAIVVAYLRRRSPEEPAEVGAA